MIEETKEEVMNENKTIDEFNNNPKREIRHRKTVFTIIRTIIELLEIVFLYFALSQEEFNVIALAFSALVYTLLTYIPHIIIKDCSLGEATISNVLSGLLYSVLSIFVVMDVSGVSREKEGTGLVVLFFSLMNVLVIPIYFVINLIVDIIAIKVVQKRRNI